MYKKLVVRIDRTKIPEERIENIEYFINKIKEPSTISEKKQFNNTLFICFIDKEKNINKLKKELDRFPKKEIDIITK